MTTHKSNLCAYFQFISSAPPAWEKGGPTRLSHSYITLAKEMFEKVCIVTIRSSRNSREKISTTLDIPNANVIDIKPIIKEKPIALPNFRFLATILSSMVNYRNVILHALEFKSVLMLYAILLKLLFDNRITLIHSAFGQLSTITNPGVTLKLFFRLYLQAVDKILCQSEEEKTLIEHMAKKHGISDIEFIVLPLTVHDLPKEILCNWVSCACLESEFKVDRVIFLGRVVAEKGVVEAINFSQTFLLESLKSSSLKLSIIGPRSDERYEQLIDTHRENLTIKKVFIQRLVLKTPEQRYDSYISNQLFIMLPTVREESSLATIEALVTGLKVIINENCSMPNYLLFPSLVYVLNDKFDSIKFNEWLSIPPNMAEINLAREIFVHQGTHQFESAVGHNE